MREIITTQDIRLAHPNNCACATDGYYTRFANNLYDRLRGFVGKDFPDKNFTRTLACKLTCYFEDIVADMGVWRMFSNECMKLYGYPVPMYHAEEEYYPDEPSLNAVRYLVWDVACELFPDRLFETDRLLLEMGQEAYRILDAAFESAPINEEAKTEMNNMLHYASEGFNELRDVLGWMLAGCYITSGRWLNEDMRDKAKEINDIPVFKQMATSMRQYFILSEMKFNNRIGPLALLPYEWLQRLAVATGNDDLARLLEEVEVQEMDTYKYAPDADEDPLALENTHGKVIKVSHKELNLTSEIIKANNGCAASFVFFKGEWRLNGVLLPLKLDDGAFEEIKQRQRDIPKENERFMSSEEILQKTNGKRIVYFKDADEMLRYLQDIFKYPASIADNKDLNSLEAPCMFVDIEDKTDNQFFAPLVERSIKDPDNPYYDAEKAKTDAVDILWNCNMVSTHFAHYLIKEGFLPDAETSWVFSQKSTHEQRVADMDFFMRTNRRRDY